MTITGECFCGTVKYTIEGQLRDARSCHCSRCRKAFSAQASAYALVNPDEFRWIDGESNLTAYVGSHGFGLQFCKTCGSTLCGIYTHPEKFRTTSPNAEMGQNFSGELSIGIVHGVTLGCINGDPEIELGMHIFVDSKASWEIIPEGVPHYPAGATEQPE